MEEGRLPKWIEAGLDPELSPESPIRNLWPAILCRLDQPAGERLAAVVLQSGDWPDEDLVVIRARDLARLKRKRRV